MLWKLLFSIEICHFKLLLSNLKWSHNRILSIKEGFIHNYNDFTSFTVYIPCFYFYFKTFTGSKQDKQKITRGPRGPWVAHLRKRSKAMVEPIIENPRGIIWTTLVEDLLMMLYIKYESNRSCSFRQEDFWKFHFKTYLLTRDLLMQPTEL